MPVYPVDAHSASAPLYPHPSGALTRTFTSKQANTHPASRLPITDRMVESVMALVIIELEQELIPAQGAGNILYVYAKDHEITHDVRRTLHIFDGDMHEAINSICTFVTEGLMQEPPRPEEPR